MFNLGLPEILLISAAALLVFGPKRLPELAKSMGKGIRDFKKALSGEEDHTALPKEKATLDEDPTKSQVKKGDHQ